MSKKKAYTADQFDHVEGLEAIQLRPGMFVGDAGDGAVEVLVREVVDNSIDEAMNGYGNIIEIEVSGSRITISDRGRGIPIEPHPKHPKISVLEVVLTMLHSGAKLRGEYGVSGGLHGIGLKALTALSTSLAVEVRRGDGKAHAMSFENAEKTCEIMTRDLKKGDYPTGTAISWVLSQKYLPDATDLVVPHEVLRRMLRERSYMNAGLKLVLKWNSAPVETFYEKDGLSAFALSLAGNSTLFPKAAHFRNEDGAEIPVEVAIAWTKGYGRDGQQGFCNCVRQQDGGTHIQGLRMAMPGVIRSYIESSGALTAKDKDLKIESADCFEGVYVLVAVRHRNPVFKGQAKSGLSNTDVQGAVQRTVNAGLAQWLEENPKEAKIIAARVISATKARIAASKAREQVRKQDAGTFGMKNFGKLKDCSSRDVTINELFIVEGDSAGGSASMGRDKTTQAIYSLKGKPLNSWEADHAKVFSNTELSDLTCAIGTGLFLPDSTDEEIDIAMSKIRYGKVVIMADADIDGCFTGETRIRLTKESTDAFKRGTDGISFIDLVEWYKAGGAPLFGYAFNSSGEIVHAELCNPRITKRTTDLVHVKLSNNYGVTSVDCTSDHRFRLPSGLYVAASDLQIGTLLSDNQPENGRVIVQSVMPLQLSEYAVDGLDVYDLTVNEHHNFQLWNGPFVHNSHIECLLLGHLYRHSLPLIEQGHVYLALPPLYRITEKGKHTFVKDDAALAAFFRKRAKNLVGNNPALLSLAGYASYVKLAIENAAGVAGLMAGDVAHAFQSLVANDGGETWLRDFAEHIVSSREATCEGVEAQETHSGAVVISGLETSGRFFTTVVDEVFYDAVMSAWTAITSMVPEEHLAELAVMADTKILEVPCGDVYRMACEIDKASRKGIALQRNKGLGEMQSEDLGETTLDRATRRLIRVTVDDFDTTGEFIGSMMSKNDVDARRTVVRTAQIDRTMVDA